MSLAALPQQEPRTEHMRTLPELLAVHTVHFKHELLAPSVLLFKALHLVLLLLQLLSVHAQQIRLLCFNLAEERDSVTAASSVGPELSRRKIALTMITQWHLDGRRRRRLS